MKFALSEQYLSFVIASIIASQYDFPSTAKGNATFFSREICQNNAYPGIVFSFNTQKKRLFYRNAPMDKLYLILSHQWHLYFVVPSSLFYVLFSDILLPVLYFIFNRG